MPGQEADASCAKIMSLVKEEFRQIFKKIFFLSSLF
jgi:hypothetical protein